MLCCTLIRVRSQNASVRQAGSFEEHFARVGPQSAKRGCACDEKDPDCEQHSGKKRKPALSSGSAWCWEESNCRHKDFQSFALPSELQHRGLDCKYRHFLLICKKKHLLTAKKMVRGGRCPVEPGMTSSAGRAGRQERRGRRPCWPARMTPPRIRAEPTAPARVIRSPRKIIAVMRVKTGLR